MRIEDRIVAFLAERPTRRFTRAGIALGIKTDRGSLLFPLRRLATDGAIRRCNPDRGPAMYQSLDKPPVLAPSEVALAKVLAAWDQWPGRGAGDDGPTLVMCAVHEVLFEHRLISPGAITSDGESLLGRARKAGVV